MKKLPLHLATLLTAATPLTCTTAAPLYWDNNGAVPGAGPGNVTTIWNTASVWTSDPAGGDGATPVPGTWVAGSDAFFSAGADATGIITITPSAAVAANSITVEEGTALTSAQVVTIGAANGAAGITINSGAKLSINSTTQIVPTSTPNIELNGGTFENRVGANGSTFLNAGFKIVLAGTGGTLNMPGPGVTSNSFNYLPTVGISGSGGLTIQGNTIQFRTGTATYSYTGPTAITSTGGPMEFKQNITGANNILPVATDLTVGNNAVFNLGLANAQVASLSGSGIVTAANAARTFTVSGSTPANDSTFGGVMQNFYNTLNTAPNTAGVLALTKSGTSALTLNGLNSQTGTTTLTLGTLTVGASGALSAATAPLTVNGGVLNLNNAAQTVATFSGSAGTVNLGPGHTLTSTATASSAYAGTLAGPGGFTKTDSFNQTLSGPNTYDGVTAISGTGTITVLSATGLGSTVGKTTVASGAGLNFNGGTALTINEAIDIAGTGNGVATGGAINVGTAGTAITFGGPITLTADASVGSSGAAGTSATFSNALAFTGVDKTLTLNGASGTGTKSISGAISLGTGGLIKAQSGTWTLGGPNTYTGATSINSGTLIVAGSITGTSGVNVTGTLGGGGVITTAPAGNISLLSGGKISPGASIDSLEINLGVGGALSLTAGVTASSSGALIYELDTPVSSDLVTLRGGALDIGPSVLEFDDFAFTTLGGFGIGDYVLVDGDTPIVGTLGAITSSPMGTFTGELQFADGGNDLILHVVPEPGSVALFAAGLVPLLRRRRR